MDEEAVVHLDKPMRRGVVRGWWGWEQELRGRKRGETLPPGKGVKMFELALLNPFTHEREKGGGTHWRFIAICC